MPALDHESSVRLRLLNFPLIVGVVYIHAYGTTIDFAGKTLGHRAARAISPISSGF